MDPRRDLESSSAYAPLVADADDGPPSASSPPSRRNLILCSLAISAFSLLALVGLLSSVGGDRQRGSAGADPARIGPANTTPLSRGKEAGVSEKASGIFLRSSDEDANHGGYPWTNAMLSWQRTAFHFQPVKNWMNDPNGPLVYRGWYHLFYQYNPSGPVWGNISWGHAVSRDLIRWHHLPLAMVPDRWYDANGVWTGSATVLPSGRLLMLYTGATNASVQVQCLAEPADPDDPFLLQWAKSNKNPVLLPPPGVGPHDFRDPTTAWYDAADGAWRVTIGTKEDRAHAGIALVYRTKDFISYERLPGLLHAVPGTGMWECVDLYPVAAAGEAAERGEGLDTSAAGEGVRHVLKASMDDDRHDYYAVGRYDAARNRWTPDDAENDLGIGFRYDWGKFYASKTFYDPEKRRRVLWGWIGETDSEGADVLKGWASLQAIPRTVLFDVKTGSNLVLWPVEEVESLRTSSQNFSDITLAAGSVHPLNVRKGTQLDIVAEFEIEEESLEATTEADVGYNCSRSGGAAGRGALGPFGLLVLASEGLSEQTAVYFYVAKGTNGELRTHFCQDESRSSKASDIVKRVVGNTVPVLDGEKLSVRILVDHSIVESFAQGGRTCATSRVYPTEAIYDAARVFLFNNATSASFTAKSVTIWEMEMERSSALSPPYPSFFLIIFFCFFIFC